MPATRTVPVVVAVIVLMLNAFVGYNIWQEYGSARQLVRDRAASGALVAATHAEWLVAASLQTLEMIDRLAGAADLQVEPKAASDLRALVGKLPGNPVGQLYDKAGKLLFTTRDDSAAGPIDFAAMAAAAASPRLLVSAITDRGTADTRHFVISRPILRGGALAGFATLRIPLDVMWDLWSQLRLGPGSTMSLVRDDGWLVARIPPPDKPVNLASYVLFTDYLAKADSGTYDAVSPVDGESRVVGYRHLQNAPLVAIASISAPYAMREFRDHVAITASTLAAATLLSIAMGSWVVRVLQRDEKRRLALARAVDQNTQLLREIHHRVKNNLQAVGSLIQLQPMPAEIKNDLTTRIAAMGAVHEQAYRKDQYAELAAADYLRSIIANAQQSHGGSGGLTMTLADDVVVSRDVALPLGLVANEVIGNAVKHAFTGVADPRIDVTLQWAGPEVAELTIRDNGAGYAPSADDSGMGSRLIRAFGQQLGGDYSYRSDQGTVFSIRFEARRDAHPATA